MNLFRSIAGLFKRTPKTPEDLQAEQESDRVRYEMENMRVSQRSAAGQNYQSGGGSRH